MHFLFTHPLIIVIVGSFVAGYVAGHSSHREKVRRATEWTSGKR